MSDVLISIKPDYVTKILSGDKSIEIRNRSVKLLPGSRMWIYSTLPKGYLEAVAVIQSIMIDSPSVIWNHYRDQISISPSAFRSYVNGSRSISAIFLMQVRKLSPSLSLRVLRSEIEGFHPPQFLKRIENSNALLDLPRRRNVKVI